MPSHVSLEERVDALEKVIREISLPLMMAAAVVHERRNPSINALKADAEQAQKRLEAAEADLARMPRGKRRRKAGAR